MAVAQTFTAKRASGSNDIGTLTIFSMQIVVFLVLLAVWQAVSSFELLPTYIIGNPTGVAKQLYVWLTSKGIYTHLGVTLLETLLAFIIGTLLGISVGMVLGLDHTLARLFDPYLKAFNAMPRVVLVPIFIVWFGLGIWSKVALGVTLVFFLVFFNVFQGVRDVNPVVLASARMLGASKRQLLMRVYLPSATGWVFSSLHASVGMAFAGAVIGEYMGSARGLGYVILEAESVFDINAVFAGMFLLLISAVILDGGVTLVENELIAWRPQR
jgi:NitT/TauT family transport system permease protein